MGDLSSDSHTPEDRVEGSPVVCVSQNQGLAQPEVWFREGSLEEEGCTLSSLSEGEHWAKSRGGGSRWGAQHGQRLSVTRPWVAVVLVRREGPAPSHRGTQTPD